MNYTDVVRYILYLSRTNRISAKANRELSLLSCYEILKILCVNVFNMKDAKKLKKDEFIECVTDLVLSDEVEMITLPDSLTGILTQCVKMPAKAFADYSIFLCRSKNEVPEKNGKYVPDQIRTEFMSRLTQCGGARMALFYPQLLKDFVI